MIENNVILSVDFLSKEFNKDGKPFKALHNVSFDLKKGEIFGVIGRNGSGKSTLLKVLSKITAPTNGSVTFEGTLTSIIEIGTGFHPDLSGKENVYMNANLLGINSNEVDSIYDQIVVFSGLEDFMNTPVKHYSSGMYLRLAFAIAFHSKIDILLLDEVLAVGDADFRRKCYDKIRELKSNGASIILVSHQMEPIIEFCDRCMWLDNGVAQETGLPLTVIENYLESASSQSGKIHGERIENVASLIELSALDNPYVSVESLSVRAKGKDSGDEILMSDPIEIVLNCHKKVETDSLEFVFTIFNMNNVRVLTDSYGLREKYNPVLSEIGNYEVVCEIFGHLLNRGVYSLGIMVVINANKFVVEVNELHRFKVEANKGITFDMQISTLIRPRLEWKINRD